MSDSVRPHRRRPTRLPRPWDSPGKNTGVGCHFLLQCMKGKSESEVSQSCPTLHNPMVCSQPGSSIHGIFQARVLEWGAIAFSSCTYRKIQRLYIYIYISMIFLLKKCFHFFVCILSLIIFDISITYFFHISRGFNSTYIAKGFFFFKYFSDEEAEAPGISV